VLNPAGAENAAVGDNYEVWQVHKFLFVLGSGFWVLGGWWLVVGGWWLVVRCDGFLLNLNLAEDGERGGLRQRHLA